MNVRRFAAYVPLALAILTAAILQSILIARTPTISADGIIFTSIARDLSDDPIDALRKHDQHPGYPSAMLVATRAVQWLGVRSEPESWMIGGRAVCFVCGLLSVWVVWLFARDLYDVRVANIAAFVFAVLPLPRAHAADAHSDVPHMLFFLIAAWLATTAITTGRLLLLIGAGVASATAYWIRPEGLEVFLVTTMVILWLGIDRAWGWRKVTQSVATLAAVTLVIVAPYTLLSGKLTSKQLPFFKRQAAPTFIAQVAEVPSSTPDNSTQHLSPAASPATTETDSANDSSLREPATPPPNPELTESAIAESASTGSQAEPTLHDDAHSDPSTAKQLPGEMIASTAAQTPTGVAPSAVPERHYTFGLVLRLAASAVAKLAECFCYGFRYVFIPLYLLGQWEMVRRGTSARVVTLLWALAFMHMAALVWVYFVSGYIASRHVLPLVALAMPFTALGVLLLEEKVSRLFGIKPPRVAVATLAICTLVVVPYSVRSYNREFVPVIEATRWVDARAERNAGIVCNSPYVGYYGTLPTTILGPDALTLDAALAQGADSVHYDYVVLHVGAHDYRPEWMAQIEQRYRMVREYADPTSDHRLRKVVVFEAIDAQARRRMDGPRS